MPAERRQEGERRSAVTELGPEAAGELVMLHQAAHPLTAGPVTEPTTEQVAAELADPDVITLGVREPTAGNRLVAAACVRVGPDDPAVADVVRLVVAPARRPRGLGSLLLRAAEHRLPGQVRELWLHSPSDESSLRLYARHGYRKAPRRRAGSGETANLVKPRSRRRQPARHPG